MDTLANLRPRSKSSVRFLDGVDEINLFLMALFSIQTSTAWDRSILDSQFCHSSLTNLGLTDEFDADETRNHVIVY